MGGSRQGCRGPVPPRSAPRAAPRPRIRPRGPAVDRGRRQQPTRAL